MASCKCSWIHDSILKNDKEGLGYILNDVVDLKQKCTCQVELTSVMHAAAFVGVPEIITLLFNKGAEVDIKNSKGQTPLHIALKYWKFKAATRLLNIGCDPHSNDANGKSPLSLAVLLSNSKLVKLILSKGGKDTYNPNLLFDAIYNRQPEIVKLLAENDNSSINKTNGIGQTPLTVSVLKGFSDICKILLQYGSKPNLKDGKEWTALHYAAERGHNEIANILLDAGAIPNCRTLQKYTPLHLATLNNHINVIQTLSLYKVHVNAKAVRKRTALHLAIEKHVDANTIRTLLKLGIDQNLPDADGYSPLLLAAKTGNVNATQELLKFGCNVNQRDGRDKTSLYIAAEEGHKWIIDALLDYGAFRSLCPIDGPQHHYCTALHIAIFKRHNKEVISLLLSKVHEMKNELEAQNINGETPLLLATLINNHDAVRLLVKAGANLFAADIWGRTPVSIAMEQSNTKLWHALLQINGKNVSDDILLLAIVNGKEDIVRVLMQNGATLNSNHIHGAIPLKNNILNILLEYGNKIEIKEHTDVLWSAVFYKKVEALRALLAAGACSNDANFIEYPLIEAIQGNEIEMVDLLINANADVNKCDMDNKTCLYHAVYKNRLKIAARLLKAGCNPNVIKVGSVKTSLHLAIRNRFSLMVQLLLCAEAKPSNNGIELLTAIKLNEVEIIEMLLDANVEIKKIHIDCAHQSEHEELVELLLSRDIANLSNEDNKKQSLFDKNINLIKMKRPITINKMNYSKMPESLLKQHVQSLIKEKKNLDNFDVKRWTVLHVAAMHGFYDIVQMLVETGADMNIKSDNNSSTTALHLAIKNNQQEVVNFLIDKGADLNIIDNELETPLMVSISQENFETAKKLLEKGASLEGVNIEGSSVLNMAIGYENIELVQNLLQRGAKCTLSGRELESAAFMFINNNKREYLELFVQHYETHDLNGCNAAFVAMDDVKPYILRALLVLDPKLVHSRHKKTGITLLHYAVEFEYERFMKFFDCLQDYGLNLDHFCFIEEETALYKAIRLKSTDVAAHLVKYKADFNLGSSKLNQSSILLAIDRALHPLVNMMIDAGAEFPIGWPFYVKSLKNITRIFIRRKTSQEHFRKSILSLYSELPITLVYFLLFEDYDDIQNQLENLSDESSDNEYEFPDYKSTESSEDDCK